MNVSIIIPVYNTEKYLSRCIDSCLAQTMQDIEIILIDDCSTDNSRDIITGYSEQFPEKVRYIFQKTNQRQGAARNRGMDAARGDFIIFVDSDDWIEPDMCEQLYNKAVETSADMVGSDYYLSWDDRDELRKTDITTDMYGEMDFNKKSNYIKNYGMFWTRMYRTKFLKKRKMFFPENVFYEDAFFNFYSVLYANRIEHIYAAFYHYYQENQSTVRNRNNPHQYERINLTQEILRYGLKQKELQIYKDLIIYKFLSMHGSNLVHTCMGSFDIPDYRYMRIIADDVKGYINNDCFKEVTVEYRFYLISNIISPKLCWWLYKHKIQAKIEIVILMINKSIKRFI